MSITSDRSAYRTLKALMKMCDEQHYNACSMMNSQAFGGIFALPVSKEAIGFSDLISVVT